ncbi:MAG: hypothetical protein ACYTG0_07135 [Planctomycetota bacterium]|jgi:hypothetical protein
MAALYGLLPRDDETVEEFREHLKRYVRTFLEGTVTAQGLLRVSAEALHLHIADEYEDPHVSNRLDTWWTRNAHLHSVFESRFDDAAIVLFGFHAAAVQGADSPPASAIMLGEHEIPATVDTRQHRFVKLSVDKTSKVVDLQKDAENPARVARTDIVETINRAFAELGEGIVVAKLKPENGVILRVIELKSPTAGADSRVSVDPLPLPQTTIAGRFVSRAMVTDEAANTVLGFVKKQEFGKAAAPFVLASDPNLDLTRGIDLRDQNLLKITVDGNPAFEIDCAGDRPRATLVDEVVEKINAAAEDNGFPKIASPERKGIKLTSPTAGPEGKIELRPVDPEEQDASKKLFGDDPRQTDGADAEPATITGVKRIDGPVDLSERSKIRLSVNGELPNDINVAGENPAETSLDEIIDAINAVHPKMAGRTDEDQLKLTVPTGDNATHLAVLPLRHIELIEYPEVPADLDVEIPSRDDKKVRHGDTWSIVNRGVCESVASISIESPSGTFGPAIINHSLGYLAHVMAVIGPGERVRLWANECGKLEGRHVKKDQEGHTVELPVEIVVEKLDNTGKKFKRQDAGKPDATVLTVPPGTSQWSYADCHASRFDMAHFATKDAESGARFAGGLCLDRGILNVSPFENRLGTAPPADATTVFASETTSEPGVNIRFEWNSRDPGAFAVNLPSDLPERFGGRFNLARFGKGRTINGEKKTPNLFANAVTEPPSDPNWPFLQLIPSVGSGDIGPSLVTSQEVPIVPLGFEEVKLPFREPEFLTNGTERQPARIYLAEEGRPGFILLEAKEPGTWGNQVYMTAHRSGPAMFDIEISFDGARFESARSIVMGESTQSSTKSTVKPGNVGVMQAKAAGIHANVTRNRARLSNSISLLQI